MIPTRWRSLFDDQLADAARRVDGAQKYRAAEEGSRAIQAAYQAVVAAASIRVWMIDHPWVTTLPASEMQRRAAAEFPAHYAALATMNLSAMLTGFWSADSARSYVEEADTFVRETQERFDAWIAAS